MIEMIALCFLGFALFTRSASAGCFIGPQLVEDDAYKGYQFTNNCPGTAVVNWKRTYKKDDGSQGLEDSHWYVSSCSTETKQWFQGDYDFYDIEVDQSGYCVDRNVEPAGSENADLASRFAAQTARNASAADTRQQQDQEFKAEVKYAEDAYQAQQRQQQEQVAEDQRRAALQAEQEVKQAEQAAKSRALAKCDADYREERARCGPIGERYRDQNGMWVFPSGRLCSLDASLRLQSCKDAIELSPEQKVAKCQSNHDQDVANCNGNTNEYRRENFVAKWVDLESRTCLTSASWQEKLCEAIANSEPQSRIDALTQGLANSKSLNKRMNDSYANWLPQNAEPNPGPAYAPSYGSTYVAPHPTFQGQPRQPQTSQSNPPQTSSSASRAPCDSTICSGPFPNAPRPYVPPPQPRFIGPNTVR